MHSQTNNQIPFSHLESWMHKRIEIPKETKSEFLERWNNMHPIEKILAHVFGRIIKKTKLLESNVRWHVYKIAMRIIQLSFKIRNDIEIVGMEKIPKKGGIFILNHILGQDVVTPFISLFKEPIGVFTSMGSGFFADALEIGFGWIPRRRSSQIMVEKMVRTLMLKNRYLAMWPEGTLERRGKIMQGFSGIVKVYSTINSKRDIIPFIPIYMRESRGRQKIYFKVLNPLFIPREWLKSPDEGGKTPREIIDYVMLKIAHIINQKELEKNHLLEHRRKKAGKSWK